MRPGCVATSAGARGRRGAVLCRRVAQGAHHAGDIAPHRVGQRPVGQGSQGLALEVDDAPTARGEKRLAQMEVTVHALGRQAMAPQAVEADHQHGPVVRQRRHGLYRPVEPGHHAVSHIVALEHHGRKCLHQRQVHMRQRAADPGRMCREIGVGGGGLHRHRPSLAKGLELFGDHEQVVMHRAPGDRPEMCGDPAVELVDVTYPVTAQGLVQLDVDVVPDLEVTEELHQRGAAQEDRRIRLLAGERTCRHRTGEAIAPGQHRRPVPTVDAPAE